MQFFTFEKFLVAFVLVLIAQKAQTQFWKLNNLNERDLFILETKASMASGICYKEVTGRSSDPELRMQVHSYCCNGYRQNSDTNLMGMRCDPICTEDCLNGICTAPDVCECYPGYTRMGGRCEEL